MRRGMNGVAIRSLNSSGGVCCPSRALRVELTSTTGRRAERNRTKRPATPTAQPRAIGSMLTLDLDLRHLLDHRDAEQNGAAGCDKCDQPAAVKHRCDVRGVDRLDDHELE